MKQKRLFFAHFVPGRGFCTCKYVIMGNMANFFHYMLQENTDSLLLKMLEAQIQHPLKNDWNSEAKINLKKLNITHNNAEIKLLENQFPRHL